LYFTINTIRHYDIYQWMQIFPASPLQIIPACLLRIFPDSSAQIFPASLLQKIPAFPSLLLLQADCQFSGWENRLNDLIHGNVFSEELHYNNKSAEMS